MSEVTESLKQAVIQKHWEQAGESWFRIEDDIDANGWEQFGFVGIKHDDSNPMFEYRRADVLMYRRPKTLAGLETNNGWKSTEIDGHPETPGLYDIITHASPNCIYYALRRDGSGFITDDQSYHRAKYWRETDTTKPLY